MPLTVLSTEEPAVPCPYRFEDMFKYVWCENIGLGLQLARMHTYVKLVISLATAELEYTKNNTSSVLCVCVGFFIL